MVVQQTREIRQLDFGVTQHLAGDLAFYFIGDFAIAGAQSAQTPVEGAAAVGSLENQPVYLHCNSAGRVAGLWMIGRVLEDGWTIEQASAEARSIATKPEESIAFATIGQYCVLYSEPDRDQWRKQASMNRVNVMISSVLMTLVALACADGMADKDREQKQAALDAACEAAREEKLAPMREQFIEECVENREQPDRRSCELFYSDFGAQSGDRAPMFYDLPECVEAFDFQNSQRRR